MLHDRRMFSEIYDSTFFSTDSTFIEIELNKRRTDSTCPEMIQYFQEKTQPSQEWHSTISVGKLNFSSTEILGCVKY